MFNQNADITYGVGGGVVATYTASLILNFTGGVTGLWDFDFGFSTIGGSLIGSIVNFKVIDDDTSTVLANVDYNYGDFPQVDAPVVDYVGNWAVAVQPFIQVGTEFVDGGSGGFTKKDWALFSDNYENPYFANAKNLRVELAISSSPVVTDLMTTQLYPAGVMEYRTFSYSSNDNGFYVSSLGVDSNLYLLDMSNLTSDKIAIAPTLTLFCAANDENDIVNGRPRVYATEQYISGGTKTHRLVDFVFDGVDSWTKTYLSTGSSGEARELTLIQGQTVNGKPVFFQGTVRSNIQPSYHIWYFDGVAWQSNSIQAAQIPPVDRYQWSHTCDNQGRIYVARYSSIVPYWGAISRLTYDGVGNIWAASSWTEKIMAGSLTTDGYVEGLGAVARFRRSIQSIRIHDYDVNNEPRLFMMDINNTAQREMNHDFATDTFAVTTLTNNVSSVISFGSTGTRLIGARTTTGLNLTEIDTTTGAPTDIGGDITNNDNGIIY